MLLKIIAALCRIKHHITIVALKIFDFYCFEICPRKVLFLRLVLIDLTADVITVVTGTVIRYANRFGTAIWLS